MDLSKLDFSKPQFPQRVLSSIMPVDAATFDNWDRFGHIACEKQGNRRLVSAATLIQCAVMNVLISTMKIPPQVGSLIAREMIPHYLNSQWKDHDIAWLANGLPAEASYSPADFYCRIVRGPDGDVRVVLPDEPIVDAVHLVVPVRMLARQVLAKLIELETPNG